MVPIIDLIGVLGGLIVPPAWDLIKKKFTKDTEDTPERTMGTLATTKPETLPAYVEALCKHLDAQTAFFNRDVVGDVGAGVRNLRASIRPIAVIGSLVMLGVMAYATLFNGYSPPTPEAAEVLTGIRVSCEGIASSWMSSRIILRN
jgi:hypothetical protein